MIFALVTGVQTCALPISTAGVIQVRTRNPSQQASGELQGSYGSHDTVSGSLYLNTPLTSNLAINFAADGYDQGKGYGRNLTTGRDIHKQSYYSLRGKILWQPRSEEHTSELQSLMRISYAVFCLKKKKQSKTKPSKPTCTHTHHSQHERYNNR